MGEGKFSNRQEFPYPTFIITDLKMPRADGFEVLRHLKDNPAFAVTPTVVLSASQDPDDIKKAYMLGASCYHVKPGTFEELERQLKLLVDYWETCRIPRTDEDGRRTLTNGDGKLGQRFLQRPEDEPQRRGPT
jgi:DNA-binding response OmpR family regulator